MIQNAFQFVLDQSECHYAARSIIRASPSSDSSATLEEHLERSFPSFRTAFAECLTGEADGYVLELPGWAGESLERLEETTVAVFDWYGARSTPRRPAVSREDVTDPSHWFHWGEHRAFVLCFAPCFREDHARYGFGRPETFVMFQHERAFHRRHPQQIPVGVRRAVRRTFDEAGRGYEYDIGAVPTYD
ncbi:hypothetical protein CG740_32825 [Streptomyces sp. CB01201]|nr:hypothetical protein CG740_32825 [Streptomyces sp. CB01201]